MNFAKVPSDVQKAKFERWLYEFQDSVLRMCYLYLSDRELAEDALQDTFLKVWQNMHRFEGRNDCSAKTWIMRIAINTCKDYRRLAWYKHVDTSQSIDELPLAFHPVDIEQREIFLDVLRLPEKYKQTILLYYYQDMTMDEAANVLGINRQAFIRRLKKAYTMLRYQPEGECM